MTEGAKKVVKLKTKKMQMVVKWMKMKKVTMKMKMKNLLNRVVQKIQFFRNCLSNETLWILTDHLDLGYDCRGL